MKQTYILFLIFSILGIILCDFGVFFDSELKSKWYWLCIIAILGNVSLLFFSNKNRKIQLWEYLLVLVYLYGLVRTLFSEFLLEYISFGALFYLIYQCFSQLSEKNQLKSLFVIIACVTCFMSSYAIIYTLTNSLSERILRVGNFDNPTGCASMLTIGMPFIFYYTGSGNKHVKSVAWLACCLTIIGISVCASRTGLLTVILLAVLFFIKFNKFLDWNFRKKLVLVGLLILVLVGLYFVKKDSADGRILIWNNTWEMIKDKPFIGHGYKSFQAKYMIYQANYFKQNPQSKYSYLADNVKHPFNEFLLLTAEFGLVASAVLILVVIKIINCFFNNQWFVK